MGAWGLTLFQSDHDMTRADELTEEAGLDKLEQQHADASNGKQYAYGKRPGGVDLSKDISYHMISSACSDSLPVRKHLDSGVLQRMLAHWESDMLDENTAKDWPSPGYKYVLLAACAMTHGCRIPDAHKARLRETFRSAGLVRGAVKQMDQALNHPNLGYKNGTPYDFGIKSQSAALEDDGVVEADRLYPYSGFINTPAPFGMPALSTASLQQIRDNVSSKHFHNKTFKQLLDDLLRYFPVVPDELYTVMELKMNIIETYPGAVNIVMTTIPSRPTGVRIIPQMPADYMAELKAQLTVIISVAETLGKVAPNGTPAAPPSDEQISAALSASAWAQMALNKCANCAATKCEDGTPLLKCSGGCKDTRYCSKKCQRIDRPAHKITCRAKKT